MTNQVHLVTVTADHAFADRVAQRCFADRTAAEVWANNEVFIQLQKATMEDPSFDDYGFSYTIHTHHVY